MKHILLTHEKGGEAVTTTTVNLAWGLAGCGSRVLIVDIDSRGDCATSLGLRPEPGVAHFLIGRNLQTLIRHTENTNLDLLPGDASICIIHDAHASEVNATKGIDPTMQPATEDNICRRMKERFATLTGYDYILYDVKAQGKYVRRAILDMADYLVIPTRLEALGMGDIASIVRAYGKESYLILPTVANLRHSIQEHNLALLRDAYKENVAPHPIPARTAIVEASSAQKTIFEYAPDSPAAHAYTLLVEQVMEVCRD